MLIQPKQHYFQETENVDKMIPLPTALPVVYTSVSHVKKKRPLNSFDLFCYSH